MKYAIVFFNASVQERISAWPVGIYASFVRITEQIVMSGPNLGCPIPKPWVMVYLKSGPVAQRALGVHFFAV